MSRSPAQFDYKNRTYGYDSVKDATLYSLFLFSYKAFAVVLLMALSSTVTFAAPTTWTLHDVVFDSGDTASGSFVYDPEPFNPLAGQYGTYSDINITVTRDGVSFTLNQVNPASRGNAQYVSIAQDVTGDLTGAVFMAITPAGELSDAGGTYDILPGPQNLSYTGICAQSNCGPANGPYKEIVSGRISAEPLLVTWYLEGVRDNDGAPINGSFGYAASTNSYSGASVLAANIPPTNLALPLALPSNGFQALNGVDMFGLNNTTAIQLTFAAPLMNGIDTVALQTGAANSPFFTCTDNTCSTTTPLSRFISAGRVARHLDAPQINHPASVTINENNSFVFNLNATDSIDSEGSNLIYSLVPGDDASRFTLNTANGELAFATAPNFEAPNDSDTDNTYRVTVRVTDFGGLTADHTFDVMVDDVLENSAPALNPIGDLTLTESMEFNLIVTAQDPDGDNLSYALANAPTGATLNDNGDGTATFRFTPTFEQSANFPNVLFIVSDSGTPMLSDTEAVNISVGDVNRPPQIQSIANVVAPENTPVSFTIVVSDPDGDDINLTYGNPPTGATFTPVTGGVQFDWTPDFGQSGNYTMTVDASDTGSPMAVTSQTVMITIGDVNRPPVLNPVGDRVIDEGASLLIDLVASDPDGQAISYALANAPTGLTLTDNGDGTGNLTWTPSFSQAGSFADVTVTVNDSGSPLQSDQEVFSLTVGNVNRAPTLNAPGARTVNEGEPLTIVLAASDPDGDTLSYPLPADLPPGATFVDNGNGSAVFNWTPAFDQAGNFTVTFRADDDNAASASDTQVVSITVGNTNRPPVLGDIGNRTVQEGAPLAITLSATDPDGDALIFALANAPTGATLTDNGDGSAMFNWLPGFDQAGNIDNVLITVTDDASTAQTDSEVFLISVGNVNRPPQLAPIGNRMVNEGDVLTFDVTATDPDGDTLNYLAPANLPPGAQFVSNANGTATFLWTPDFNQAGNATVVFEVNDSSADSQTVSESITITVGNVNRPPQLMPIGDRSVAEGTSLTVTLNAVDPDGDALSFPAPSALPNGATLVDNNDGTATFNWTPDFGQAGTVNVVFEVNDSNAASQAASESITITINNVNRPPQLMPVDDRSVTEGTELTLTLNATDPDGDALSFPAPAALPDGATLVDNGDGTATFSWTPTAAQAGAVILDFTTTDGSATAQESVAVTVAALPVTPPPAPTPTPTPTPTSSGGGGGAAGCGELLLMAMAFLGLRRRTIKTVGC